MRIWAVGTGLPVEPAKRGEPSLSGLLAGDDATDELGAVPFLGLVNARQRMHALSAQAAEDSAPLPESHAAPPTAESVFRADVGMAEVSRARSALRVNDVNVRHALLRLERWTGASEPIIDDSNQQEMRLRTVDGVVDRLELHQVTEAAWLRHADAVAQQLATAEQNEVTENNTTATLALTVVVGAATFSALAGATGMKVAIGVLTGTLLGSLGYLLAFGKRGNRRRRGWLLFAQFVGAVAAPLIAEHYREPNGWLIAVGVIGFLLAAAWFCALCRPLNPNGEPRPPS